MHGQGVMTAADGSVIFEGMHSLDIYCSFWFLPCRLISPLATDASSDPQASVTT